MSFISLHSPLLDPLWPLECSQTPCKHRKGVCDPPSVYWPEQRTILLELQIHQPQGMRPCHCCHQTGRKTRSKPLQDTIIQCCCHPTFQCDGGWSYNSWGDKDYTNIWDWNKRRHSDYTSTHLQRRQHDHSRAVRFDISSATDDLLRTTWSWI